MKCVVSFSSGIGSWAAAKRCVEKHGAENVALLFADTFIEDEDNYRFLIEAAANVIGVPIPDCAYREIPGLEEIPERKRVLQEMADQSMREIPGLHWISDGRTPWEVMGDAKFIGNSRVDPCSKILKRELMAKWVKARCGGHTEIALGIGWDEDHRIKKVIERNPGWNYTAPMCDAPFLSKAKMLEWARSEGLEPPRLYGMGFPHANCGGFCIKAGQASFAMLLKNFPERYRHHEEEEESLRAVVGNNSILRIQRGKRKYKITLKQFREMIESGKDYDHLEYGGCGCALPV
jgi:hypothetical protein